MRPVIAYSVVLGAVVLAGAFAACSKTQEPAPSSTSTSTSTSNEPAPKTTATPVPTGEATAADLAWDAPASWKTAPNPSSMRKATYIVMHAKGDPADAELSVSKAAGGVDPNVQRWAGQFGNAKPTTEKKKVNDLDVTIVQIKGTYAGGGGPMAASAPPEPKEKYALLGAIVDLGDQQWFFKMIGPERTVTAARPDFDKLVASLRRK